MKTNSINLALRELAFNRRQKRYYERQQQKTVKKQHVMKKDEFRERLLLELRKDCN